MKKKKIIALCIALAAAQARAVLPSESSYVEFSIPRPPGVTQFSFTFKTTSTSHVRVLLDGVRQVAGYTVALNANQTSSPGGTVTFMVAPTLNVVRIERSRPFTQDCSFGPLAALRSSTLETCFDNIVMQTQQAAREHQELVNIVGTGNPDANTARVTAAGTTTTKDLADWMQDLATGTVTGTAMSDLPSYGPEVLVASGWTSAGWTGDFATGWTHTPGNTSALASGVAVTVGVQYQLTWTITNRTAGKISLALGGRSTNDTYEVAVQGYTASGAFGPTAITTDALTVTPTADFDGTVVLSVKAITGTSTPVVTIKDSGGTVRSETRTGGSDSVFIGVDAGRKTTTGAYNVGIGTSALAANTTGFRQVGIGWRAFRSNTTGRNGVAIGYMALDANTIGASNVGIGYAALALNTTGVNNVGVGGDSPLYSNVTGNDNVAIGYWALYYNTASNNVAMGTQALAANTSGASGVGIGYQALTSNTTGNTNVAVGEKALGANTVGGGNVGIGYFALRNVAGNYNSNTAIGDQAGRYQADGVTALATPASSVYVGALSKGKDNSDSNSIVIGAGAVGEGANTTVIGSTNTTKTHLFGVAQIGAAGSPTISFGAAAPGSGTWVQGSVVFNSGAAVGQPKGWQCTVGGTPGTWVSMGNL